MARLLTIPTMRPMVSMEERRAPGTDPDIIPLDDAPVEAPVVDAGTGTGGEAAQAENIDALAASTSPEAPAAAEADPGAEPAADSSVTDAPSAPAAADDTTPPAAGDAPVAAESDVAAPAVGEADIPAPDAVDAIDIPPVDDPVIASDVPGDVPPVEEPAPVEPATDVPAEPVAEPAASAEGDIAPVPDDVAPVAPAETVNEPAAEASVTDAPAIDPATDVPAAPAGEEQAAAVADLAASDAAAAPESPVDAGAEPVAPADTQADIVPEVAGADTAVADTAAVDGADTSLPSDVASDVPPVTGEAPVAPEADLGGAPSGEAVADDLSASTVPDDASAAPADDIAAPGDAAADAPVEAAPAEPVDPVADIEPEEMTSAWVDGVAVDAEEVKAQIEEAASDVVDADTVTDELEDAAVALEELAVKVSENLADDNPVVSETTVNLTRIVAEKSLERIGEVMNLPASLESAVTAHDRLRITLEAIADKAQEIWEAIKKALAAAWQAIVNFFKTLFNSALRVKESITKLRAGIKAINGSESPTADKVTGPVVNSVGFDGWNSVDALKQRLTKLTGGLGPFLENSKSAIHDVIINAGNKLIEITKSDAESKIREDQLGAVFGTLITGYSSLGVALAKAVADGATQTADHVFDISGIKTTTSGELPGGFQLDATDFGRSEGVFTTDHIHSLRDGRFIRVSQTRYDATEGPAAKEDDMLALLDITEQLVDAVIASKDSVSKFESDIASFRRQAETALKDANSEFVKQANVSTYIRAVAGVGPSLVRQNSTLISMAVTIANNVVKYVTASAKLYPSFGNSTVKGETTAPAGAPALAAPAA